MLKRVLTTVRISLLVFLFILNGFISLEIAFANNQPSSWKSEWSNTDFTKSNIDFNEVLSGGPPKDGIPAIDNPRFKEVSKINNIGDKEPVISLSINGDIRAYPIRILMYHEIVNDTVGDLPVIITYCPLCNASLVFERKVGNKILDFGTTGKLRRSDMIMYDRQTESWWQQFLGEAIVGKYTGSELKLIPSRIESFSLFKKRYPKGKVLVPNNPKARPYGRNPYAKYDSSKFPFLFKGDYTGKLPPLSRVVAIGQDAWPISLIRNKKIIKEKDFIIKWVAGQNSSLDSSTIAEGKDIGNVTVTRNGLDIPYNIPFAFAFKAFYPNGVIHLDVKQ